MKVLYRRWATLDVHRVRNGFLISRILEPSDHLYIISSIRNKDLAKVVLIRGKKALNLKLKKKNEKEKKNIRSMWNVTDLSPYPNRPVPSFARNYSARFVFFNSLFNSTHIVNHLAVQCFNSLHLSTTYSSITPFCFLRCFETPLG